MPIRYMGCTGVMLRRNEEFCRPELFLWLEFMRERSLTDFENEDVWSLKEGEMCQKRRSLGVLTV